ncbi:hypothetical protein REPUB_Repub04eG0156300 [Reevesia pubescens]
MDKLRRSTVPKCGHGLSILVVDHDTTSLMYLASMLEQFFYKVTTTELVSVAMSLTEEGKNRFKLVMANINLDDINSVSFMRIMLKRNIPFILISSERSQKVAEKAIVYGACLHLEKPVSLNDLKYLSQHVYRKPAMAARSDHFHGIDLRTNDPKGKNKKVSETSDGGINVEANCIMELKKTRIGQILAIEDLKHGGTLSKTKRSYDDKEEKRNDKRIKPTVSEKKETIEEGGKQKKNVDQSNCSRVRKSRLVWNQELHHKFTAALSVLGDENRRPKLILKMMNEPNLTHRQVASHLQVPFYHLSHVVHYYFFVTKLAMLKIRVNEVINFGIYDSRCGSLIFPTDTNQFPNLSQQDSTAHTSSQYLYQQFPNVPQNMNQTQQWHQKRNLIVGFDPTNSNQTLQLPNMPRSVYQKPNFILDSDSTSILVNQSQVFVSSTQTTEATDYVASEYIVMPDADKSLTEITSGNPEVDTTAHAVTSTILSENWNQHSTELADLLKVLDEEVDESIGYGIEPHPGDQIDQFCEWLKEALLGNNEQP